MSFKPIETQEELDALIKDRIERAKKTATEPFSDYDDIKAKNESYESEIAKLTEQLKEQSDQLNQGTTTVDELNQKIKEYETASIKARVSYEAGLPIEMIELAEKLMSDDIESIREGANGIAKYIVKPAAPIGTPEVAIENTDPIKADMAALANSLKEDF